MTHRIENLTIHPALRDWMRLRFGESCSSTEMLMTLSIVYVRYPWLVDLEEKHMKLVGKIVGIAERTGRPQRVPTFREYDAMSVDWSIFFEAPELKLGSQIVPRPVVLEIERSIVEREHVAKLARIGQSQAA
ncbi:hypothetical protein ACU8M5_10470 [Rhizobium leguminosarum]